jgi:hypothetical protein
MQSGLYVRPLSKDERKYIAYYVMNIKGHYNNDKQWAFTPDNWRSEGPRHDFHIRLTALIVGSGVVERPEGGLMVSVDGIREYFVET